MSDRPGRDPLYGAAVLRLTFELRGLLDDPGFRIVYRGTLRDLDLTDDDVRAYVDANRGTLERAIREKERA